MEDLPYWFKAGFTLKILEIFCMQYTKDNFKQDKLQTIRNEIPMLNLENLEIICGGGGEGGCIYAS